MGDSSYSLFKISHLELVADFEAVKFRLYYEIQMLSFGSKNQLPSYRHGMGSIGNKMALWKSSDCISHLPGSCLNMKKKIIDIFRSSRRRENGCLYGGIAVKLDRRLGNNDKIWSFYNMEAWITLH